jgi:hypothetical protein
MLGFVYKMYAPDFFCVCFSNTDIVGDTVKSIGMGLPGLKDFDTDMLNHAYEIGI